MNLVIEVSDGDLHTTLRERVWTYQLTDEE